MISHRVERWGPWIAALAVTSAFLLFGLAGLYTFNQQNHVNARLCEGTVTNREALRAAFFSAQTAILQDTDNPALINRVFQAILQPIPPLECVNSKPVPKEER